MAVVSRRSFFSISIGAALAVSPLGSLVATAAAPAPAYKLPFPGGLVWRVGSAVNSGGTHSGRSAYAWDFGMPEGSPITASRAGVVAMVKDSSNQNCRGNIYSCPDWNNYVVVDHGDGTTAAYLHGLYGGARVRVGQGVNQGDLLCLSGNTGQSGGPHLHFQVQYTDRKMYVAQSFLIHFDDVDPNNGVPVSRESYQSGNAALADFDIRGGHFYTQSSGLSGRPGTGFAVTDAQDVPMWSTLVGGGGVERIGLPVSRRFRIESLDHVYQIFQRQIFGWSLGEKQMQAINIPELAAAPVDGEAWLRTQTALPLDSDFSASDRIWNVLAGARLQLLDDQPIIKDAYWSIADPVSRFGLPLGAATETPMSIVLRTGRAVFQLAKVDSRFAKAGQVTVSLSGIGALNLDPEPFSRHVFEPEPLFPEQKLNLPGGEHG